MHYIEHLSKDRKLKKLIEQQGLLKLRKFKKVYLLLCISIFNQQLSSKVGRVIYQRFLDLYDGKEPTPEQIVSTPFEKLRAIGMSNAKVSYVQNVARFEIEKGMGLSQLGKMSNEEVIEYLTGIKGVGRWTVEMLLMFTLGREDVFAPDDIGIQNAMVRLYKITHRDKKKLKEELLKISAKWSPYRTYACRYLWHWRDNEPVKKEKKKRK